MSCWIFSVAYRSIYRNLAVVEENSSSNSITKSLTLNDGYSDKLRIILFIDDWFVIL
jgi:hypothetical protein